MHENEIVVLLLGSVVLAFIFLFRSHLSLLPAAKWLFASYFAAWVAWFATVAEHFVLSGLFNVLEHLAYALNGVLLFVWCWFGMKTEATKLHD